MGLDRSAFKWAALAAVAAGAFFAAASASAEVSWSIGIGAPVYCAPAPVYTAPPINLPPACTTLRRSRCMTFGNRCTTGRHRSITNRTIGPAIAIVIATIAIGTTTTIETDVDSFICRSSAPYP